MLNIKPDVIPVKPGKPKNSKIFEIILFISFIIFVYLLLYNVIPEKKNFQKMRDARSFIPYLTNSFFDAPLYDVYIIKQRSESRGVQIYGKAESLEKLIQWYEYINRNNNPLKAIPELYGEADFQDFTFSNVVSSTNGRPINQRFTVCRSYNTIFVCVECYR
jgi:hypothetical protein